MPLKRRAPVALVVVLSALAVAREAPADEEVTISPRTRLGLEAGYGGPLGLAATGELCHGLGVDVRDGHDRVRALVGLLGQVHAGTAGGKLSLGIGARARVREEGDDFTGSAAAALKLSLARTWSSRGSDRGVTYLGPEVDLSAMRVSLTLGPLFRVGGAPASRVRFSWGIGVRL
jgi:hypothetical protein